MATTELAKPEEATTAVVKVEEYMIATMPTDRRTELIRGNLGDSGISLLDLDRPTISGGKTPQFELIDLSGETQLVPSIDGIIIGHRKIRVYWPEDSNNGGDDQKAPPNCHSDDCETGLGSPGGNCYHCPLSQYKSAAKGAGQACNHRHLIFLAQPQSVMPMVLSLSPTSLKNARRHFYNISNSALMFYEVITQFTLESMSKGSNVWAVVNLAVKSILSDEAKRTFKEVTEAFAPHLRRVPAVAPVPDNGDEAPAV